MIYNKTFEHIKESLHIIEFYTIDELSKHYKCDVYEILIFLINHGIIEINKDGFKLTKIGTDFTDGEDLKCCKFESIIGNMILYDLLFHKHNYDINICKKLEQLYNGEINITEYQLINQFEIEITL